MPNDKTRHDKKSYHTRRRQNAIRFWLGIAILTAQVEATPSDQIRRDLALLERDVAEMPALRPALEESGGLEVDRNAPEQDVDDLEVYRDTPIDSIDWRGTSNPAELLKELTTLSMRSNQSPQGKKKAKKDLDELIKKNELDLKWQCALQLDTAATRRLLAGASGEGWAGGDHGDYRFCMQLCVHTQRHFFPRGELKHCTLAFAATDAAGTAKGIFLGPVLSGGDARDAAHRVSNSKEYYPVNYEIEEGAPPQIGTCSEDWIVKHLWDNPAPFAGMHPIIWNGAKPCSTSQQIVKRYDKRVAPTKKIALVYAFGGVGSWTTAVKKAKQ